MVEGSSGEKADIEAQVAGVRASVGKLRDEVGKVVVGLDDVIEQLFICLFCRGHAVLEGVPGLAKTLLVSTIAEGLDLKFSRVQFTPDLMPSDITGTEVIEEDRATGKRELRFVRGPLFANVVLADEINRTPPKTQAALLEAMQERRVTAGGVSHELPQPFFVLATQNPLEQEGTYPLPEAQLDRFLFMIRLGYPTAAEELEIIQRTTAGLGVAIESVLDGVEVMRIAELVRDVPVAGHVAGYAVKLARATRGPEGGVVDERPDFVRDYVSWGAGPRASQAMVLGAKAHALLAGRTHVTVEDVRAMARPVLRHRVIRNFNAEADGVDVEQLIDHLLEVVEVGGVGGDGVLR